MTEHGTDQERGRSIYPPVPRSEDLGRQIATGVVAALPRGSRTGPQERKSPGAALVRLASRLGVSVEKLVANIPSDTVRRTRYPVREQPQPDGTTLYEHDLGIVEGRNASVRQ
jgi:hypothetical protein